MTDNDDGIKRNIDSAIDYLTTTYGDYVSYWERKDDPANLPMGEREAWHRDAWDREQVALKDATSGQAGNDAPGNARNFGYASPSALYEG